MDLVKLNSDKFKDLIESKSLFNTDNKDNDVFETVRAYALAKLVNMLDDITEYKSRELMTMTLYNKNPFVKDFIQDFSKNKKHIDRKFSKEILLALKLIAVMNNLRSDNSNIPDSIIKKVWKRV